MSLGFPAPPPVNGDDFDATPIAEDLEYLLQILQSYDLQYVLAGSALDSLFAPSNSPLQRFMDAYGSFVVSGGLSGGFSVLSYTIPAILGATFQSNGVRVASISGQTYTAAINSDTYISIRSTGVINTPQVVANNAAAPALPSADSQWLQKVITNGTTITSIVDLRNLNPLIGAQQGWQPATYQNSWVDYDPTYNGAGYWKDWFGVIHLRGAVKSGTVNTAVFKLPVTYRPAKNEIFATFASAVPGLSRIDVNTNGDVIAHDGGNTYIGLDGITFRAGN